jgi:hypothetical protein
MNLSVANLIVAVTAVCVPFVIAVVAAAWTLAIKLAGPIHALQATLESVSKSLEKAWAHIEDLEKTKRDKESCNDRHRSLKP